MSPHKQAEENPNAEPQPVATIMAADCSNLPADHAPLAMTRLTSWAGKGAASKECLDARWVSSLDRFVDRFALTHESGILTRLIWPLVHRLPRYQSCPRMDLEVPESLERRVIDLPSSFLLARHA